MGSIEFIPPLIKTYEDLRNRVEANQGIFTFHMRQLRQVQGAGRIGPLVNSEIRRKLAALGLSHQPKKLPERQERLVRVFKKGSPVAAVITAVQKVKFQNDAVIRKAAVPDMSST